MIIMLRFPNAAGFSLLSLIRRFVNQTLYYVLKDGFRLQYTLDVRD